jgi:hypothetical protein
LLFPKQGQIGGWRKSERTVKGTSSMHPNWKRMGGKWFRFMNVKLEKKNKWKFLKN